MNKLTNKTQLSNLTITMKLKELEFFIKSNQHAAEQGSQQWLNERKFTIGGSEISTIEGCNAFSKIPDLISQKVGLTSFTGNTATRWGNLFENVSELLFKVLFIDPICENEYLEESEKVSQEMKKLNKIYATGGIQHKTIKNHKYSPDGLCVMAFIENSQKEFKTALLEFKSPSGTVPTAKVPKHYLPQVKAGLCTIDLVEIAVFSNNMFRKCPKSMLDFSIDYDKAYHRDTELKLKNIGSAIANSMILFSIPFDKIHLFDLLYKQFIDKKLGRNDTESLEDQNYDSDNVVCKNEYMGDYPDSDSEDYNPEDEICDDGTNIIYKIHAIVNLFRSDSSETPLIDFGEIRKELFEQVLEMYKPEKGEGIFDIRCCKPQINKDIFLADETQSKNLFVSPQLNYVRDKQYIKQVAKKFNYDKTIQNFVAKCKKNKSIPVGYLPWKLLRSSNIVVEYDDPDYLINLQPEIDKTVEIIRDIATETTKDSLSKKLEAYFPGNDVTKNYNKENLINIEFRDYL